MNEEEIKNVLGKVMHPEINASLIELGVIKEITSDGNKAKITMAFPFPGIPIKDTLVEMVKQPLEKVGLEVEIEEATMNEESLQKFFKMAREKWKVLQ